MKHKNEKLKWLSSIINMLVAMYMLEKRKYIDLLLCSISIYIMLKSVKGKKLRRLGKKAKKEVKKVVWPSKKEIMKTTSVVLLIISIISITIWTIDSLIIGILGKIINRS